MYNVTYPVGLCPISFINTTLAWRNDLNQLSNWKLLVLLTTSLRQLNPYSMFKVTGPPPLNPLLTGAAPMAGPMHSATEVHRSWKPFGSGHPTGLWT